MQRAVRFFKNASDSSHCIVFHGINPVNPCNNSTKPPRNDCCCRNCKVSNKVEEIKTSVSNLFMLHAGIIGE